VGETVGPAVGELVGPAVVGEGVGPAVGELVGAAVGELVGAAVVGEEVGPAVVVVCEDEFFLVNMRAVGGDASGGILELLIVGACGSIGRYMTKVGTYRILFNRLSYQCTCSYQSTCTCYCIFYALIYSCILTHIN